MPRRHEYAVGVEWTGNTGSGYRGYSRAHIVSASGKPDLPGSADPAFRGDTDRWNPEELLVASLAECHMLWYLALCAQTGIVVIGYTDTPLGVMVEASDGGGRFEDVTLRPQISIASADRLDEAISLHEQAHRKCFIANSVNFPVRHSPVVTVAE